MGNVIEFRRLTGVLCPECEERMAFDPRTSSIECVTKGCGHGYLRAKAGVTVRVEGDYTIIESKT